MLRVVGWEANEASGPAILADSDCLCPTVCALKLMASMFSVQVAETQKIMGEDNKLSENIKGPRSFMGILKGKYFQIVIWISTNHMIFILTEFATV